MDLAIKRSTKNLRGIEPLKAQGGADELPRPKRSEWVFAKPNAEPYTAGRGFAQIIRRPAS